MEIAFAGPWIGEFGWEVCVWQAYLRELSHDYDKMYISTFPGMEPLYSGFHCETEFLPHKHKGRALEWRLDKLKEPIDFELPPLGDPMGRLKPIKQYRVDGEFIRYGTPTPGGPEVLFHARGIQRGNSKNWHVKKWADLATNFKSSASIGTAEDIHVEGTEDLRGIPLLELMNVIASAEVVVGQSSGVMHLASMCGTRQVVWGDDKTHFSETLEMRYRETWNPLGTPVSWVHTKNWNPTVNEVLDGVIQGTSEARPTQMMLNAIRQGYSSGRSLIAHAYIDKDSKIITTWETRNFPSGDLLPAMEQVKNDMIKHEGLSEGSPGVLRWQK